MTIQFGWRIPDFPLDGTGSEAFRDQIFHYLDLLHGNFDSIWVGDHFFPWLDTVHQGADTIEAWTTLTYMLSRYPRLRGGTIVLSQGYRSPALLAKMALNLQWLSQGRFVLGIGAGWKENEYRAYGYDFPSAGVRLAQLEEAVQVIRAMWREEAARFTGQYYQVEDAYCTPRPDPQPPLLIGGHGRRKTLRLVAQYADWPNFNNCSPEEFQNLNSTLAEHCRDAGRDPATIVRTYSVDGVAVANSRAAADAMLQNGPFGQYSLVSGTPDDVTRQIETFALLGVKHMILRFVDFPSTGSAEMFIRHVLPRFPSQPGNS